MPVISLLKLDILFVTNNTAVVPYYWVFFCKVQLFWKGHKNLKKSSSFFDKSADLLSKRQNKRKIFSNFVAFSEYMNFIQSKSMLQHIAAQRGENSSEAAVQICEQPLKIQFLFLLFDCFIFSQIDNFNIAIVM